MVRALWLYGRAITLYGLGSWSWNCKHYYSKCGADNTIIVKMKIKKYFAGHFSDGVTYFPPSYRFSEYLVFKVVVFSGTFWMFSIEKYVISVFQSSP